jgi:hypothetical protein
MLKRLLIIVLSVLSIYGFCADYNLKVGISTKRPLVGEVVQLSFTADKSPELAKFPEMKNARWLPNYSSSSTSIINSTARYTRTYAFRAEKEGKIVIPALSVEIDGKTFKINSLTLKVSSAGDQKVQDEDGDDIKLKDIIFGKAEILNPNKEFYVGEEISLEINVFSWNRVQVRIRSYPEIKLDKIVFKDYGKQNRENSRFIIKNESLVSMKNREFLKESFETAFRAIAPGTYKTTIKIETAISLPTERRDFFGRPVYKQTPYIVEIPFEVKVKPLPEAPEKANFLGLVGNWDVNFVLKNKTFKVGEPLTLAMNIYGLGTLETLNIPKLEADGFRMYPPEIDKKRAYDGRERAEVKYVLIPLSKGEKELKISVSTFSSVLNKYKTFDFSKKIKVEKSDNPTENISYTQTPSPKIPAPEYKAKQKIPRSNILFLKTALNGTVQVPLYLNWLWAYIILGLLGPICWLISDMKDWRQKKLGSNIALQRRRAALKRKSKVIKAVQKSSDDELNTVIVQEAVPFINDMLNLPPGTTTSELSGKVKDSNLAQCLNSAGEASYLPGASNLNKKELRSKLCKALKTLTLVALFLLMPQLQALEETAANITESAKELKAAKSKPVVPANLSEAIEAYDSGNFGRAAKFFRSKIDKNSPDPALLYNLGTCLCNKGDLAGALVCFERAHLLAPYDSAITENLNFVRRRLFLPEAGKIDGPTEMLIAASQSLRPDEWLLIAAFAWALAGIFLAFRRKLSTNKCIIFIGSCGIVFMLAVAACVYEKTGVYSNKKAVVTASDAELRSLPSTNSGQKLVRLRLGTVVRIIESRLDWVRIKSDDTKGWLLKDKITRIAPGNDLPPEKDIKRSLNLNED